MNKTQISVVISLLNEQDSLKELMDWIHKVMTEHNFSYEVIFVDDGSTDNSWQIINELSQQYEQVKAIKFRRNYGKSAGLYKGFEKAEGDVVITIPNDYRRRLRPCFGLEKETLRPCSDEKSPEQTL